MSAPVAPTGPAGPAGARPAVEQRRRNPWIVGLLGVVCLALAAMWVYGLWFAPRTAAYRVSDPAWRAEADRICGRYDGDRALLADVEEGYIEDPTPEQMRRRADIVDRATDLLEAEIAELQALPLATERDRALVEEYAGFFRTLIADRRAYTARLRELRLEPYLETKLEGGPVTNLILDFTTVNEIPKCRPPGELGGGA